MFKFANMQTKPLISNICSWKFSFSIGVPRERKLHNYNRYGSPDPYLWGILEGETVSSLYCLLSRVLRPHLEVLKRILWSTESTVNQPKLAGLQYGQTLPVNPQEHAEERGAESVTVVPKNTAVPLQSELQNMCYYTGREAEAQLLNSDRHVVLVPTVWQSLKYLGCLWQHYFI